MYHAMMRVLFNCKTEKLERRRRSKSIGGLGSVEPDIELPMMHDVYDVIQEMEQEFYKYIRTKETKCQFSSFF